MKAKMLRNRDRFALMSDYGEFPEYNVDEYADRLAVARRKFDRLCRFSLDEHEASSFEADEKSIDWESEKRRRAEVLDRWRRETFGVMSELLSLLHQVRHDETVLEVYLLERTSTHGADSSLKAKKGKSI
jgi:hypothetical protein